MTGKALKKIAIVGASGHGKVIAELAENLGYDVSFFDDAYPNITTLEHWVVSGTFDDLLCCNQTDMSVFVAIGNNNIRALKIQRLEKSQFKLVSLVHPSSIISKYAVINKASAILASAVINAFAKVGTGCIVNSGAIIEHDCSISDFVHISPNVALAGGVKVGNRSWIGIGSNVKQLVEIGSDSIIGAGSTVIKNIDSNVIAYGSPAIIMKKNT